MTHKKTLEGDLLFLELQDINQFCKLQMAGPMWRTNFFFASGFRKLNLTHPIGVFNIMFYVIPFMQC